MSKTTLLRAFSSVDKYPDFTGAPRRFYTALGTVVSVGNIPVKLMASYVVSSLFRIRSLMVVFQTDIFFIQIIICLIFTFIQNGLLVRRTDKIS